MSSHRSEIMALSVWQPWASLIAIGAKEWETRGWMTLYRGPILIHAAKRWSTDQRQSQTWAVSHVDLASIVTAERLDELDADPMPLGVYLAMADLVDCRPTSHLRTGRLSAEGWIGGLTAIERKLGDFNPGRFGWRLANLTRFYPPIPGRGQQGLFAPPADVLALVQEMARVQATP